MEKTSETSPESKQSEKKHNCRAVFNVKYLFFFENQFFSNRGIDLLCFEEIRTPDGSYHPAAERKVQGTSREWEV